MLVKTRNIDRVSSKLAGELRPYAIKIILSGPALNIYTNVLTSSDPIDSAIMGYSTIIGINN